MIAGLILAAGESSRMGRDKALLPYRGRTFLETIVNTLREAGIERIAVVLGHHAEEIQRAVSLEGVEVVVNPDYKLGQTSSLQCGLRALISSVAASPGPILEASVRHVDDQLDDFENPSTTPGLDYIVLCLVDHPSVSAETIRKLTDGLFFPAICVAIPTCGGKRGHPVVIAQSLFRRLLKLRPDQGANTVIRWYYLETVFMEVDDPGILLDIDDPDTFGRLEKR